MQTANFNLTRILNRLQTGHSVEKNEIKTLLNLSDPGEVHLLFKSARTVRKHHFGNTVFLYGFLYFSTYCRNDCRFCQSRQSNKMLPRYRKTKKEILTAAREMSDTGVHLIDLTMGEDPELYSSGKSGFKELVDIIRATQHETRLPVMISPGILPDIVLAELARADVAFYACYQETHNKTLYKNLRHGQGFEKRMAKKRLAKNLGMLIEEGILTGAGESDDDLVESIFQMKVFGVDQARVMTFVPQVGTPMADTDPQDSLKEQKIIALMRLVMPDVLIPASLDVNGLSGLKARLDAGANVVTSIVPPENGLAGVANNSLDIEDSRRTLSHILPVLKTCGLIPAETRDYLAWITNRQNTNDRCHKKKEKIIC